MNAWKTVRNVEVRKVPQIDRHMVLPGARRFPDNLEAERKVPELALSIKGAELIKYAP